MRYQWLRKELAVFQAISWYSGFSGPDKAKFEEHVKSRISIILYFS